MRRIATSLAILLLLFASLAQAQVSLLGAGALSPAPSGGGGGPLTYTATATGVAWQTSISPPATFSANIGTAAADRRVVVVIAVDGNASNGVISGVTINGVSATKDVGIDPGAAGQGIYIYRALVTSGSGAQNIVISCNGFPGGMGIAVGTITGSATTSFSASNTVGPSVVGDPHSLTTTVPANGVGVVGVIVDRATTPTWSNATGDTNTTEPSGNTMALLQSHTTNNSPSFTGANFFNLAMIAATYAP